MTADLSILLVTAATIGLIHTILGPDHYIPFVAMAKAGGWSRPRLLATVGLCGLGHVLGSVAIGLLGIALGWTVGGIEAAESSRGAWAAWGLIGFGLVYGVWGIRRALRNRPHSHIHTHADGIVHAHEHSHTLDHAHVHRASAGRSLTPWILFVIFVLGPCEPLIPLLMLPAVQHSWWGLALVTGSFGVVTIGTMSACTLLLTAGLKLVPLGHLERWSHALAGAAIAMCGAGIRWLGL